MEPNPNLSNLEDQIRECFGRVVYTHKTHEKMADICATVLRRYKLAQIGISVLTTSGALAVVVVDHFVIKLLTAGLSLAGLWIAAYMKGFDPGGAAQRHRDAAATLWNIRESYLSLLTDLRSGFLNIDGATKRRDELQDKLSTVYKGAPQTTDKAYQMASAALKKFEDYTFSGDEIDKFLPESLHKAKLQAD